nr:MAG TPA: hypothetical protein [Caudoviricetes sp.]
MRKSFRLKSVEHLDLRIIFSFYLRTVHRQNNISAHQNFTQLIF